MPAPAYAAEHADYNFCASFGFNTPAAVAPSVARLVKATEDTGRECGALVLTMIIADETDAAAEAKWQHYVDGTDLRRSLGATTRPSDDPEPGPLRRTEPPAHLDRGQAADQPGRPLRLLRQGRTHAGRDGGGARRAGVMMTFDDFVIGMEQFGTRIMPLMRCRDSRLQVALT